MVAVSHLRVSILAANDDGFKAFALTGLSGWAVVVLPSLKLIVLFIFGIRQSTEVCVVFAGKFEGANITTVVLQQLSSHLFSR